jgi:hypothetical protein
MDAAKKGNVFVLLGLELRPFDPTALSPSFYRLAIAALTNGKPSLTL